MMSSAPIWPSSAPRAPRTRRASPCSSRPGTTTRFRSRRACSPGRRSRCPSLPRGAPVMQVSAVPVDARGPSGAAVPVMAMPARCPDITVDKAAWFQHFDKDGSGYLDLQELIHALATTFNKTAPEELASMSDTVGAIWCAFDMDMNAQISMREFTTSNGLADTIIATINHRQDRQNRAL